MNIAICDDEPIFSQKLREVLKNKLLKNGEECNIFMVNSGSELIQLCFDEKIDAVFLDIIMPQMDGFQTAEKLKQIHKNIMIVFISGKNTFVYQSFNYNPVWFIPKDDLQWVEFSINKLITKYKEEENEYLFAVLNLGKEELEIDMSKIKYFFSEGHYVNYIDLDGNKSVSYRCKLSEIETQLEKLWFVKTHNRYLVNLRMVSSISNRDVVLFDKEKIPISKAQKKEVGIKFQNYLRSIR